MILTYSYSTHMNNYSDNEWVVMYYRASILKSKSLGYKIKLYGCDFTYHHLHDIVDEFVSIENMNFILTDDLKIYIHSVEDLNCITIDGDVILNHKLKLPTVYDIICDCKGQVNHSKEISKYKSYLNIFEKYDIQSEIKYFDLNGEYACNMGILKFNNIEIKKLMIDTYLQFKEYYLKNIKPHEDVNILSDPSIIICEYMFERIINKENINVGFYSNHNNYTHYASARKFGNEFKQTVNNILYPNKKQLI